MAEVETQFNDEGTGLFARQLSLQAEAGLVRAQLDLDRVFGDVGEPVVVGSAALGLMAWRDLDITVICPSLNKAQVIAIAGKLAAHPDMLEVTFRDDSGRWNQAPDAYPDGLYIGLRYHPEAMAEWRLDVWFVDDPERQSDLLHLRSMPGRLTDDKRLAILQIKTIWSARPEYRSSVRSWDIYKAVLDHGVRDPDEFERWLSSK
jgi:hypothetical protein